MVSTMNQTLGLPARTVSVDLSSTKLHKQEGGKSKANNKSATLIVSRKRVTFCEKVKARRTIHLNNYTDDEIDACWYSDLEYYAMKEEIRAVAHLLQEGIVDIHEDVARGLESRCSSGASRRRELRQAAIDAVLDEQEYQDSCRTCDPDYMALMYKHAGHSAVEDARIQGLCDQRAAYPLMRTDDGSVTAKAA